MTEFVIAGLLLYTLCREAFFLYSMHKLVNKLMSRNYHEYKSADEVYKPRERQAEQPDNTPIQDVGILDDYL